MLSNDAYSKTAFIPAERLRVNGFVIENDARCFCHFVAHFGILVGFYVSKIEFNDHFYAIMGS